jgi:hypothetical protein
MRYICGEGCEQEVTRKTGIPGPCETHGRALYYAKALGRSSGESSAPATPRRRAPMKRAQPDRDWTDARAKVEEEGCCRICKRTDRPLEAAHVLGREHDEPKIGANGRPLKTLYVDPDRIVPACGPFPEGCHGEIHSHQINVVHHLTMDEQLRAVRDAGGIAPAWSLLARVEHREEIEATAYKPEAVSV